MPRPTRTRAASATRALAWPAANVVANAPTAACTARVNATSGFSRDDRRAQFHCFSTPSLGSTTGRNPVCPSPRYLTSAESGRVTSCGAQLDVLKADVRLGDIGIRENREFGCRSARVVRERSPPTPKSSALPTHADTHAGFSPDFQAVDAHVALLDLTRHRVELRRVVGTDPSAVAATETDVRVLDHRAVLRMLGIGAGRAAL